MMRMVWCLLAFGLLELSSNQLHAGAAPGAGNLQVVGEARNKLIPIALEGFVGEVAGVLKFDLEVMAARLCPWRMPPLWCAAKPMAAWWGRSRTRREIQVSIAATAGAISGTKRMP